MLEQWCSWVRYEPWAEPDAGTYFVATATLRVVTSRTITLTESVEMLNTSCIVTSKRTKAREMLHTLVSIINDTQIKLCILMQLANKTRQ